MRKRGDLPASSIAAMKMPMTDIRNVIFDIGNVVVRWSPQAICEAAFGAERATPEAVAQVFGDPLWLALNRGERSADDTMQLYRAKLGWDDELTNRFFSHITDSLSEMPGTLDLIDRLKAAGYRLFALTDNVHEIMAYLRSRYDFLDRFEGVVNSAEVGLLKPDPAIFRHALETYGLVAEESLFLDDLAHNVSGAQAVGMKAIQFVSADQAEAEMRALAITV